MSPVQGAMIAATIVNNGRMVMPHLVQSITAADGKELYRAEAIDNGEVISPSSAGKLREMMEETVISGTSRKSFRPLVRDRRFRELEVGGKTGHLTGDNPRGRVDWFVGYATDDIRRVSIAALTVNKEFWTVKSSHLANVLFRRSFEDRISAKPVRQNRREVSNVH